MRVFPIMLAAVGLALAQPAAGTAQELARVAGFQAFLFNSKTGALSGDVLAKDGPELGNVSSGRFASVSALVVARIEFGKQAPVPKAQVRLVATESGSMPFAASRAKAANRVILDRTSDLGPVNADGTTYVGFWLAGTGCRSLSLKASLIGLKDAVPLTGVLPFACYE